MNEEIVREKVVEISHWNPDSTGTNQMVAMIMELIRQSEVSS